MRLARWARVLTFRATREDFAALDGVYYRFVRR